MAEDALVVRRIVLDHQDLGIGLPPRPRMRMPPVAMLPMPWMPAPARNVHVAVLLGQVLKRAGPGIVAQALAIHASRVLSPIPLCRSAPDHNDVVGEGSAGGLMSASTKPPASIPTEASRSRCPHRHLRSSRRPSLASVDWQLLGTRR